MVPVPSEHGRELTDPAIFEEACARHGLVAGYFASAQSTVPRFRVLVPGVSREIDLRRIQPVLPGEWWEMVHSVSNDQGEPLLRVVQSEVDERWINVKWTEAGRAQWAEQRGWRELARRRGSL